MGKENIFMFMFVSTLLLDKNVCGLLVRYQWITGGEIIAP
jgi:hypothetical protein